jgi:hypothetical protein
MQKVDYKKELKELYLPSIKEFSVVKVPNMSFLMIDGTGNPNTSLDFKNAVESLYALSYNIKFMVKKSDLAIDFSVMPLEGLWWTDDMTLFGLDNKDIWQWTLMIMQPEFITADIFKEAIVQVEKKKLSSLSDIRFESFNEGLAVQIMYIGPYQNEAPTIEKMHKYIKDNGYQAIGKHHEIYLSDARRTASEKLKTILRQPCTK